MKGRILPVLMITTLGLATVLVPAMAHAMPIHQFDSMSGSDQSKYVTALLKGSIDGLKAHGRNDQANKILQLFLDNSEKGGTMQMIKNLQIARVLNQKNASDPKFVPYQVENAFAVTLKDNGVEVPVSFLLTINKDFKPSASPK